MIALSEDQRQALQQAGEHVPLPVLDPQTSRTYFLLSAPLYERVRGQLEPPAADEGPGIPPGIRRSKEAFLRDLPQLMQSWWYRGKWVAYHGQERIGISWKPVKLIRKCVRRGLKPDEYYLGIIQHHEPEPVEIEPSSAGFPD